MRSGGWGAPPVLAIVFQARSAADLGLPGRFAAWVVPAVLVGLPRALLALPVARSGRWSPRAARAAGAVRREPGRAQRGLDLFLGQNRTNRGSGDATAP